MKESGSFWGGYPYPCSFSGAGVKQAGKKRTLPERSAGRKDSFSGSVLQNDKEGSGKR